MTDQRDAVIEAIEDLIEFRSDVRLGNRTVKARHLEALIAEYRETTMTAPKVTCEPVDNSPDALVRRMADEIERVVRHGRKAPR